MAQSADPLHPTAVDMMLTACLPGTWWAYFDRRGLIWQGEKAALHRALMARTIQPIDAPFNKGEMALIFEDSSKHVSHLGMTLDYWNKLFV